VSRTPEAIEQFLAGRRIAIAGVSRDGKAVGNVIFKRLAEGGREVIPLHPNAETLEGVRAYADVRTVPGELDGVMFAAPPRVAVEVVRQCAEKGVKRIWFHRSIGEGSVSEDAVRECERLGVMAIVGGCPFMYGAKVDPFHGCMRWWLAATGKIRA